MMMMMMMGRKKKKRTTKRSSMLRFLLSCVAVVLKIDSEDSSNKRVCVGCGVWLSVVVCESVSMDSSIESNENKHHQSS